MRNERIIRKTIECWLKEVKREVRGFTLLLGQKEMKRMVRFKSIYDKQEQTRRLLKVYV